MDEKIGVGNAVHVGPEEMNCIHRRFFMCEENEQKHEHVWPAAQFEHEERRDERRNLRCSVH